MLRQASPAERAERLIRIMSGRHSARSQRERCCVRSRSLVKRDAAGWLVQCQQTERSKPPPPSVWVAVPDSVTDAFGSWWPPLLIRLPF